MSEHLYLLTICLPLGAIVVVFAMRYISAVQQARARLADDEAYRQIAGRAVAAETANAAALSAIQTSLADVATRLAEIEKVLKTIE
jgi:hypothetical protein